MLSLIANVLNRRLESDCERMPSGKRQHTSRDGTMALALL